MRQVPASELHGAWELVKGVLITVSATGTIGLFRLMVGIRDDVRLLMYDVRGSDGQNGIKSRVRATEDRLDAIEQRNLAIDARATAAGHPPYTGLERRRQPE